MGESPSIEARQNECKCELEAAKDVRAAEMHFFGDTEFFVTEIKTGCWKVETLLRACAKIT